MTERPLTGSLNMQPVGSSLDALAASLVLGYTNGVCLEPGDGMSYRFLVAPCWAEEILPAFSGTVADGGDWLFVAPEGGLACRIRRGATHNLIRTFTEWRGSDHQASIILAEFLKLLWLEIDRLSMDSAEVSDVLVSPEGV